MSVWGERVAQPAQAGMGRVVLQHLTALGKFKGRDKAKKLSPMYWVLRLRVNEDAQVPASHRAWQSPSQTVVTPVPC